MNETIGLTLSEVEKEVYVGSYRCDLVGKDEVTGEKVIIENQLEASNHDHLGKIITYASGLDATVVVWIVKEAREEHRSAMDRWSALLHWNRPFRGSRYKLYAE